ncbi:RNA polymerase sigma factor [Mucilaginibacter galii]|uniref:DNA-directed RNA polymerase sigma-70 factor n=1 Tax=Mucilaginibacter galii TaxID=2005073 RepID=A0A917N2A2_9SPHI|nr:RNA polymerase sigma-70 factor [Mucilaginibacter galii]GGI51726.1 DNA-directed RNA polymerase sigma-70 factor [Mucilaginibacter galii]
MSAINQLSDQELVHSLKNGDRMAFSEIYKRYAESLAGFAASKLYDLDDARDVLHDLFVKLWEDRFTLTVNDNLRSFLFAAIRYKIIDKIRRNVTRQEYDVLLQALAEPQANGVEQQLDAKELQQLVDQSLEQLPAKTKLIYQLSRNEYLSVTEIAQQLNLSEQTVKNQLSIALKHLRQAIAGLGILALMMDWLNK